MQNVYMTTIEYEGTEVISHCGNGAMQSDEASFFLFPRDKEKNTIDKQDPIKWFIDRTMGYNLCQYDLQNIPDDKVKIDGMNPIIWMAIEDNRRRNDGEERLKYSDGKNFLSDDGGSILSCDENDSLLGAVFHELCKKHITQKVKKLFTEKHFMYNSELIDDVVGKIFESHARSKIDLISEGDKVANLIFKTCSGIKEEKTNNPFRLIYNFCSNLKCKFFGYSPDKNKKNTIQQNLSTEVDRTLSSKATGGSNTVVEDNRREVTRGQGLRAGLVVNSDEQGNANVSGPSPRVECGSTRGEGNGVSRS